MNEIAVKNWYRSGTIIVKLSGALLFTLLTILSAQIRIPLPFTPVPMTLQTFVVPLAGGFLGASWGAGSMILYMILGIVGLHTFAAASSGMAFFFAPTAGYVSGFIVAAGWMGWARDRLRGPFQIFLALILSHLVIFACGVAGLLVNTSMDVTEAINKGVLPFLLGDAIKLPASYFVLLTYLKYWRKDRA